MGPLMRVLTRFAAGAVLATVCTPALSLDPLTLILLRIVRDKLLSTGIESAADRVSAPAKPPLSGPSTMPVLPSGMDDVQLRRLVDEGFVQLTSAQRSEVYDSVRRILLDPNNAAEVPALIADLAVKASAMRQAHESLSNLSAARKQRIAVEAGAEYEKMPLDTREELATAIRARVLPMPVDLTDMILAELNRVQAQSRASKP